MLETSVWPLGREDPWSRKWQPTSIFLPGKSHGQRSLAGCSPWCRKESDSAEWLSTHACTKTFSGGNNMLGASLSITNSRSLPKLMSIESVMPSNHLIICHPLLILPSIFPSIRVFSNESALHIRWPKYGFRGDLKRGLTRMSWLPISPSCLPFQPSYLYEILRTNPVIL